MCAEPSMYYFDANEYDLKYADLNLHYILSSGHKYFCVSQMSKTYYAMKWGSMLANQWLLTNFHSKLDTFLSAYKQEYGNQKKNRS